ncbi:MAG: amylo-alpha-1,6-glucosidase [Candidatus Aenigmatarchaeota archaeon]
MEPSEEIELPFIFSCSEKSMDETTSGFDYAIRNWKGLLEGKIRMSGPDGQIIRTPDKEIDKAFVWNVMGLESLIHESRFGTGILAGLPWFTEFWARDSFISIPALNHIGKYEISRKMLEMFISRNIPSKIDIEGNEERDFADTLPLFLLAVKNYLNSTGDLELLMQVKKQISHIAKKLQLSEGLVIHDHEKTWMDSYARGKSAIEVQSLWCEVLGETNTYLSKTIENNIKIGYWNPKTGYFLDSKNPDIDDLTENCIAPVFFGQVEGQKVSDVLDSLTRDFMSKWGIRTRSIKDKEYKPDSYHKGSVWGLTTGAAACTYLKHNRIYNGVICLKAMASEMGINAVGSSGEALNADTGELLGCGMQAWSSAMFITAVDGFVFGIIPELDKNLINIQPRIPDDWNYMERFGKRIGKHKMNLLIRRDHARLVVDINFDSSPLLDAKLVLPSNIKKMIVNGKVFIGNSVCFELRRQNNIVALP